MYIKILVYIIDNQQFKLKISILFFGSLVVFRSHLPPFLDWGGGPKNGSPAGVISGRWSVPHITHIPTYSTSHSYVSPTTRPAYPPHIPTCPSSQHIPNFIIFAT